MHEQNNVKDWLLWNRWISSVREPSCLPEL
jgi:hypothetical protein